MKKNARRGRASFMKPNPPGASTRGKRVAAYKSALNKGLNKDSARRSALRKVPFTANERRKGATFAGSKAKKRAVFRRNRSASVGGGSSAYARGFEETFGKGKKVAKKSTRKTARKGKRKTARKTRRAGARKAPARKTTRKKASRKTRAKRRAPAQYRTVKTTVKRKRRVAYGKYKRAKLYNPRTGRMEYSYMYRTKSGRLRRIPTGSVIGGGKGLKGFDPKRADKVRRGRQRAADRLLKEGGVFVANKRRKKAKSKSRSRAAAGKRLARYNKLLAQGYTKAEAKAIAFGGKKMARKGGRKTTRRKTDRRKTTRRTKRKSTKRRATKRRASGKRRSKMTKAKRRAAALKGWRKQRRSGKATAKRKTARRTKRRAAPKRRMRKNARRKSYAKNRRRSYRKNKRTRRMKKNAFMANLVNVLKTGALATSGYLTHRVLTSLACEYLFSMVVSPEGAEPNLALKKWEKPICGFAVGAVGFVGLSMLQDARAIKGETANAVGAGMVASFLQSVVVSALMSADQPKAAAHLEGYSNSMAYQLRGNRRRGLRGMTSIMPRYVPLGQYEQAAAGVGAFQQAAAGFSGGSMGEYFQANAAAVGEYFVPRGTQGIGQYEPAGPLAMQAAAGTHMGQIDDGIRPDSNLDRVMDLAESAAGLGEYITATPSNGGWNEGRVPTQSQWIPNGPLWAGELSVKDTMRTSETAAGILAGPGGNGILSGG